ncbi:MAG: YitT family protein [Lachnospiraceae bacterium]|nr:YitT family protein [Lachnospiraceae bacterium]
MQIFSYMILVAGAMLAAFSIEEFLVSCTILDDGIVGISIVINDLNRIFRVSANLLTSLLLFYGLL